MTKLVTITIISRRSDKLLECLESLNKQTYKNYEILVVWNGNKEIIKNFKNTIKKGNVKFIIDGSNNVSRGRNIGINQAKGYYIAFTDDDCVPDKEWLKSLILAIEDNKRIGGVGSIRNVKNKNVYLANLWQLAYIKIGEMQEKYDSFTNDNIYLCTSSALFRKEALEKIQGFDETLTSGEDSDISVRIKKIGYFLKLEPKAIVLHYHPESILHVIKQQIWYGKGDYILYKKYHWDGALNNLARFKKNLINKTWDAIKYSIKLKKIKLLFTLPLFVFVTECSRMVGYISAWISKKNYF